ncbi:MAG: polysaccharide export protein [Elusimicrobia bacterium]|nr:polysaccharide export protein [Elusimicrobiota bacterium]
MTGFKERFAKLISMVIVVSLLAGFSSPGCLAAELYKVDYEDEIEILVSQLVPDQILSRLPAYNSLQLFGGQIYESRVIKVGPDGTIQLPLLDPVYAKDLTVPEIKEKLTALYVRFFNDCQVQVRVVNYISQAVFVSGEVRNPGRYQVGKNLDLLEAIALAGGPSEKAWLSQVRILRTGQPVQIIDVKNLMKNEDRQLRNIIIAPHDVVYVPRHWWPNWQELFFILSVTVMVKTLAK